MAKYISFKYGSGIKYNQPLPYSQDLVINYRYLEDDSLPYLRLKNYLVDEHVYDKDSIAEPYKTTEYEFTGTTEGDRKVDVYVNDAYAGSVTSKSDGTFTFYTRLIRGLNSIRAQTYLSDTSLVDSNVLYITTYNIFLWLASYASEFVDLWGDVDEKKNNTYLKDADEYGMLNNFACYTDVERPEGASEEDLRELLQAALGAHYDSTTWKALKDFTEKFIDQTPKIVEYYQRSWLPSGTDLKVYVDRVVNGTPTLIYNYNGGQAYLGNGLQFVKAGSDTAYDDSSTYVYVDGEVGLDGYLVVKKSTTEPIGNYYQLARVVAASGDITNIYGCGRLSIDGIGRSRTGKAGQFEIYLNGFVLTDKQKDTVQNIYHLVKPIHKLGFLWFSDETIARKF